MAVGFGVVRKLRCDVFSRAGDMAPREHLRKLLITRCDGLDNLSMLSQRFLGA